MQILNRFNLKFKLKSINSTIIINSEKLSFFTKPLKQIWFDLGKQSLLQNQHKITKYSFFPAKYFCILSESNSVRCGINYPDIDRILFGFFIRVFFYFFLGLFGELFGQFRKFVRNKRRCGESCRKIELFIIQVFESSQNTFLEKLTQ
jgi:hypothetical protein